MPQPSEHSPLLETHREAHKPETDLVRASLLMRAGINPERFHDANTCQRAEDRYGEFGCTLLDAVEQALRAEALPFDDPAGNVRAALGSVTGQSLLEATVNAAVIDAYEAMEDTTAGWTRNKQVKNFRPQERIRIDVPHRFEHVPRGGDADMIDPYANLAETYSAARFGRWFCVDEQDVIDDILEVMLAPARVVGEAALRLRQDLCYSVLLENAAMADGVELFHADHGNVDTTHALAEDKLDSAIANMGKIQVRGQNVGLLGDILIVPYALRGKARRLARAMELVGDKRNLRVISDPRLDNGMTHPKTNAVLDGSSTSWYLASSEHPEVEFGHLGENPEPIFRSFPPDPQEHPGAALGFSIHFDVGAAATGYKGLRKATA